MSEDILERAKKALIDDDMTYEDYDECISLLIAEVERLRSFRGRIARILGQSPSDCDDLLIVGLDSRIILAKRLTARIKELEAEITAWVADRDSWIGRYEAVRKEKDARIADQEAYIERLEAAFLEQFAQGIQAPKEKAELMAREALEEIKNGMEN